MEKVNKTLLTSLYNKINLYSELVEIFKYLQKEFLTYFEFDKSNIDTVYRRFIGAYNHSLIIKEKEAVERVFHEMLINTNYKGNYDILNQDKNIDEGFIIKILDSIENNIICKLNLFKKQCQLEFYTSYYKYGKDEIEIYKGLNIYLNKDIPRTISYFKLKFMKLKKDVINILKDEVNNYHRLIWNTVKNLRAISNEKDKLDEEEIMDKIIIKEDEVLSSLDDFQERIDFVIKEEFLDTVLNLINKILGNQLNEKIKMYKEELNKYLSREISEVNINRRDLIKYTTVDERVMEKTEYNICYKIFSIQHDYLNMMLNISKSSFDELNNEIKSSINTIFYNEFFKSIYYINSEEDFYSICSVLEEKFTYIIYGLIKSSLKSIKDNYYDYIVDRLIDNIKSVRGMNVFKSINSFAGNIKVYNQSLVIDLFNKFNKIHDNYKSLKGYPLNMTKVISLDGEGSKKERIFLKEYIHLKSNEADIFKAESYCEFKDLISKKEALYNNIVLIKIKLWKALEGDFITYFDHLFQSIDKNLEYVKSQEEYYNNY